MFADATKIGKPLAAIVEYVFSASLLNVYITKFSVMIKVSLNFVFTPNQDKEIAQEAKAFAEKLLLNRTVGIAFERVDESGNFVARVHHPSGDIARELVKAGYAKVTTPKKDVDYDKDYFHDLQSDQLLAQTKKL